MKVLNYDLLSNFSKTIHTNMKKSEKIQCLMKYNITLNC